ncbi:hypothetical protein KBZ12_07935 [Cyanobium sp. Cruz CV13-4-11]|uniref:hypothetical protein n=1 Tax=unclassified Cyanobium TaxID=2627006 RepID=UPI0020CF0B49|nr:MULTISPECIES: hypothetical protein [unclassified Cyanobium]MCP9900331.1 hypothetical protein [Cyanobium sp. Cruz CV11-17]MCP9919415.1 hypothetical protein [Cyanobium sp. Cruz CV13-4-11]
MIVFLDSNAVIYPIEAAQPLANNVRDELTTLAAEHPQLTLALRRLSWLGCRVGPLERNDQETLARHDSFFCQPDLVGGAEQGGGGGSAFQRIGELQGTLLV